MDSIQSSELQMDTSSLFKEEVVTDQKIGTIRILTPITVDGAVDESRKVTYLGQTQMLTPAGALPLNFEIEADNLAAAVEEFAKGAQQAMEKTMEELKELRRQQSSSIVVPGAGGGGSQIQMP